MDTSDSDPTDRDRTDRDRADRDRTDTRSGRHPIRPGGSTTTPDNVTGAPMVAALKMGWAQIRVRHAELPRSSWCAAPPRARGQGLT